MKSEKILNGLNQIDDSYIAEADPSRPVRRRSVKWIALAASLCLLAAGIFAVTRLSRPAPAVSGDLPMIRIAPFPDGTAGFEGIMLFNASDLQKGNPWTEKSAPDTLPVFKNGRYDPNGLPAGLTREQMEQRLLSAAKALGLPETKPEEMRNYTDKQMTQYTVSGLTLSANGISMEAEADGTLTVWFMAGSPLPEGYSFTHDSTSDQEAERALQYLAETYADLLGFSAPKAVSAVDYTFSGVPNRTYTVYDAAGSAADKILQYNFRSASFAPDDEGNLMLIRLFDGLANSEKLGDYPVISVKDAEKRLLNRQFQTTVPLSSAPEKDRIAKVELVYRTGRTEETLLPYYRFWLELPDGDGWQMNLDNGLKTYGAYYVPAVSDAYIEELPLWDGSFNF